MSEAPTQNLKALIRRMKLGEPIRVVIFGDSISWGSQVDPDFDHSLTYHRQWHEALQTSWPQLKLEINNVGIPGNRIADAHARVESDVIAHDPHLVVIEFGINDCWQGPEKMDDFEAELARLVARLREALPDAALILLTANMMNYNISDEALKLAPFARQSRQAQVEGWNAAYMECVRRVAASTGVPLADGYAEWVAERARGTDTDMLLANLANHPTREGHGLLARALLHLFN
jgi:lysophospholipase L1-like esterase